MSTDEFQRGEALIRAGRADLAERYLRAYCAAVPDDALGHAYLASALLSQRRFDEAAAESEAALAVDAQEPFAHYTLAVVLMERKEWGRAATHVAAALRLAPDRSAYHALRANLLVRLGDHRGCLECSERGLSLDPTDTDCQILRSLALAKLGMSDAAEAQSDETLRAEAENAVAHANAGYLSIRRGRFPESRDHFAEALRLQPNLRFARKGMALVRLTLAPGIGPVVRPVVWFLLQSKPRRLAMLAALAIVWIASFEAPATTGGNLVVWRSLQVVLTLLTAAPALLQLYVRFVVYPRALKGT